MNSLIKRIAGFWKGMWRGGNNSNRELAAMLQHGTGLGTYSGAWTDSRTELVRHFRHWTYVAIDRIASKIAVQIPNVTLVRSPEDKGDKSKYLLPRTRAFGSLSSQIRSKALTPLLSHQNLEPVKDSHPLLRLLQDPNEPDTSYDLWYETVLFFLLTGSAYWWVPRNKVTGLPEAIWVIPSHWVWPVLGREQLIDGYEIRPVEGNYMRKFLPYSEVIHFKRKNPISKIDGYSPQTAINHWLDTQESVDRTRFFAFKNGTFPTVAVKFNGSIEDATVEKMNQIEAKFASRYVGETRANKPLFVPPGMDVASLNVSPAQMMFCESGDQLRDNILAAFGVPASVAGINKEMTYGSVLASQAGFCSGTIVPLCRFFGQVATENLAWRYDRRLKIWWEDCTPEDPEMLEKRIITDLQCYAITPNEVRSVRGREPYPFGGDDPIGPQNIRVLPFVTGGEVPKDGGEGDTTKLLPDYQPPESHRRII